MFALCDRMIGKNPKVEVAPFSVSGHRDKEYQFLGQQLGWQDVGTLWPRLRVKKRKALGQVDRRIQAEQCKIPLARKRENTLRRNPPHKKKNYVNIKTVSLPTLLSIAITYSLSLALNLKKEERKEKRR